MATPNGLSRSSWSPTSWHKAETHGANLGNSFTNRLMYLHARGHTANIGKLKSQVLVIDWQKRWRKHANGKKKLTKWHGELFVQMSEAWNEKTWKHKRQENVYIPTGPFCLVLFHALKIAKRSEQGKMIFFSHTQGDWNPSVWLYSLEQALRTCKTHVCIINSTSYSRSGVWSNHFIAFIAFIVFMVFMAGASSSAFFIAFIAFIAFLV